MAPAMVNGGALSGPKREALWGSSDNGMRAGLALCRCRETASARSGAGRLGSSKVLGRLGRGKRSVGGIGGVSGRHEVSQIGRHGLAGLSTSMMTMRPR